MRRTFKTFARLLSTRGVPVIIDRHVKSDGTMGELRVRYGEKIQVGRAVYPMTPRIAGRIARQYLLDNDASGRPFRQRRHSHTEDPV